MQNNPPPQNATFSRPVDNYKLHPLPPPILAEAHLSYLVRTRKLPHPPSSSDTSPPPITAMRL